MVDKRAEWIVWGARQLGSDEVLPNITRAVVLWDEAYWCVYDLVLDQYTDEEEIDYLVESIRMGDIAIMCAALATNDEGWIDVAIEKLLRRFDRRLKELMKEQAPEYYFRWFGTAEEDYRSDAEW
jgi:hypothetical protein